MQAGERQLTVIPEHDLRRQAMEGTSRQLAKRPWQSPAVLKLAGQLGEKNGGVLPMIVEGPVGTILSAVGENTDHAIAGNVLAQAQQQRVANGIPMSRGRNLANRNSGRSFGMVYEHKDSFGRPKYVGHSSGVAEEKFARDASSHQNVKNLLTYEQGRSEVVWAGCGTFPLGHEQMLQVRTQICDARAQRNASEKLSGPKPYSKHGF
jgi:hypothetical protein